MGRQPRAGEACHCDECCAECCAIRRNINRPAARRPSSQTVLDAWNGPRRGRLGATVDAAVGWLRGVLRDAVRSVINAVEDRPYVAGGLALFLIGGAYIVAPAATWGLLKSAAAALAAQIGTEIHAAFLEYV
jgi:hypothetical protein